MDRLKWFAEQMQARAEAIMRRIERTEPPRAEGGYVYGVIIIPMALRESLAAREMHPDDFGVDLHLAVRTNMPDSIARMVIKTIAIKSATGEILAGSDPSQ